MTIYYKVLAFAHILLGFYACLWHAFVFISWVFLHFYIIALSFDSSMRATPMSRAQCGLLQNLVLGRFEEQVCVELVARKSSCGGSVKFWGSDMPAEGCQSARRASRRQRWTYREQCL